jgi:hypothetical protein
MLHRSRPLISMNVLAALSLAAACALGCSGTRSSAGGAQWPTASKIDSKPLPSGTDWPGVYFINTAGSRGYMHILSSGSDDIHGCWLAEDKHAKATFTGKLKDNVAMFDWTEQKVGFAGAPSRVSAYLVLTPDPEGRDKVEGQYGEDLSNDGVNKWAGVRQKGQQPKENGCELEAGDTVNTDDKPLN